MLSVRIQIRIWMKIVLFSALVGIFPYQISGDPVMSFPDSGVYSLFPHEDLRTGKSIRPLQGDTSGRVRGDLSSGFSSRQGGSRVIFDDERLNFRGHFDSRERNLQGRLERLVYPNREEPIRHSPVPAYAQSRLPPSAIANEPTKIHVFNPASQERPILELPRPDPLDPYEEVQPGRLLIPGLNRGSPFIDIREPGNDNFINHDEYLDYHTKAAISALQSLEGSRERRPYQSSEAKRLLFSSQIHGLIPPSSSFSPSPAIFSGSSSPESGSKSTESFEPGFVKSGEEDGGKIHISSLLEKPPRLESIKNPVLESGFIPIRNYIGQQQTFQQRQRTQKGEEELPRTVTTLPETNLQPVTKVETSTEETSTSSTTGLPVQQTTTIQSHQTTLTTKRRHKYPYVKKSNGQVTRVLQTPWPTIASTPTSVDDSTLATTQETYEDSEAITFSPSAFDDFIGRRTSAEFAATKIRTDVPLIFLDSQQDLDSGKSEKNAIFIKRLKNPKNPGDISKIVKSKSGVESSMTIVAPSAEETDETSGKFVVTSEEINGYQSTSSSGIVAKVHAHVSNCPKLHTAAEILCDVHIRKRHGRQNPQLIVGWKRKFHNATKEDILLAVNTTLAYIEEDFHDKFNVTLTAGISPTLRSVLNIAHVQPNDTGNYECQVDDGVNKLRSDTLLFLCH